MEVFSFEKKIKHYSSYQKILLAGEGDFSFSVCLARAFGLAINMVATSLDSRESLILNYSKAMSNVKELEARGCKVLHEVDVHSMSQHPFLIRVRFDRIIYNFPHAGFFSSERNRLQIWFHQDLVRGFLKNACEMLTAIGEIHVTHKTTFPFTEWKIVELAKEVGLHLVDEEQFSLLDYPGYENKRGAGMCDKTFHVGMCSTFKFAKLLYSFTTSWSGCSGINGPHMQRMPDLEALLLSAERRLQSSSSPVISSGATALATSHGGRGGRGGRGFGNRGGFAGRGTDRRSSFSPSRPGFSSGHSSLGASYGASRPASHQQRFGSTFGPGVLGPPPSSSTASSFGPPSARGPLQCFNCHGFGHIEAVYPSKASSVPPPPSHLQGMIAQYPSHGGNQQWVADTDANTHITNDLSHLSLAREYHGSDNVGGVLGGTDLPLILSYFG
ncbi:unnamed protein product [Prunus brigantina]